MSEALPVHELKAGIERLFALGTDAERSPEALRIFGQFRTAQGTAALLTTQPSPELSTEDLFKLASPSVVLVEVFDASGEKYGTGSGFVASDGAIVTNYDVMCS